MHLESISLLAVLASLLFAGGCSGNASASGAASGGETAGAKAPPRSGPAANEDVEQFVGRVFAPSGELGPASSLDRVIMSDEAWKQTLSNEQYRILRTAGTERAGTGELLKNKSEGAYTCAGCGLPLFWSDSKFESGTGWPSFFRPIAAENIGEHVDVSLGMRRVEVHCARCDGHLGHVFEDGPRPTGLRYCVNSGSLGFTPADDVAALAEDAAPSASSASTVFAGGCFWCVEAVFEELDGVQEVVSGYAGGTADTANYKEVCSGTTGHAEAVKVVYDPAKIKYEDLLRVHFATHDPTTKNRQGADAGPQYRSAIFYANEQEEAIAKAFIADLEAERVFAKPVTTTLEPLEKFYEAEAYHQNYVCANPMQGYVRSVALPKVAKVRKSFKHMLKDESPLDKTK